MSSISNSQTNSPSGFSFLVGSRPGRALCSLWTRLNDLFRPLLPLLHLAMLLGIGTILCAVVFANQHLPCWYDEICMVDPAFHRATSGIWHSIAQWDSIDVVPFAPNYPLLINILRFFISVFGVKFWLLRGAMLVFGLVPLVALLWLFRSKGILRSRAEVIQSAYFSACFSFFWWAIYIRPEALLLSVVTLLVFAWSCDRPVLLFLCALLVPLCGLQWNILILPVVLHWLFFGGRLRAPILVALAFAISSIAIITAYHVLGMWPSYLQEAARAGGEGLFAHVRHGLYALYSLDFARWLGNHRIAPPLAFGLAFIILGGFCGVRRSNGNHAGRWWLFLSLSVMCILFGMGLLVNLGHYYVRLLLAGICLFAPVFFRKVWQKWPTLMLVMVLLPLSPSTLVLWHTIRNSSHTFSGHHPRSIPWLDESSLERILSETLEPADKVCCPDSAYLAVRSHTKDLIPLCYAFDLSDEQVRSCSAILLEDNPIPVVNYDYADWRQSSFTEALTQSFAPDGACEDLWSFFVTPDELLATIANQWHCTFTEIPLDFPKCPKTIRFRIVRPVFPDSPTS